jgi:Fur family ferric uptake transcriptional regulator
MIMKTYHTHQRKSLLDFLKSNSDKAFTIEEIIENLSGDPISQSTVYRLMTKLVEENLVHRTVKGNSRSFVYQYISDEKCENHLHIKCTDCGKVYHLDSGVTSIIQSNTGFEIDSHTLLLGKCGECKE